ncbi:MAG TPA: HEAT repeat domain-containing protein [Longimicrobiaceae bacterium]|nr:HEAT repeat domain-containing protein [Longimicrobiaceae bacterium]
MWSSFATDTAEEAILPREGVDGAALNGEEPLVRGHAAWALGRIGTEGALQALRGRAEVEEDEWVREELSLALSS